MRYYISGRIKNNPNYEKEFKRAELWLNRNGYQAINPCAVNSLPLTHKEYMQIDFKLIDLCDGIYMLKGWQKAKGACAELVYAKALGKHVKYEDKQRTFKQIVSEDEDLTEYVAYCEACGEQTEIVETISQQEERR